MCHESCQPPGQCSLSPYCLLPRSNHLYLLLFLLAFAFRSLITFLTVLFLELSILFISCILSTLEVKDVPPSSSPGSATTFPTLLGLLVLTVVSCLDFHTVTKPGFCFLSLKIVLCMTCVCARTRAHVCVSVCHLMVKSMGLKKSEATESIKIKTSIIKTSTQMCE